MIQYGLLEMPNTITKEVRQVYILTPWPDKQPPGPPRAGCGDASNLGWPAAAASQAKLDALSPLPREG